jgi:hypothetical protein
VLAGRGADSGEARAAAAAGCAPRPVHGFLVSEIRRPWPLGHRFAGVLWAGSSTLQPAVGSRDGRDAKNSVATGRTELRLAKTAAKDEGVSLSA